MMDNQEMQRQFQAAKQMAGQNGISGVVYLDVDQDKGSFRMKFKVTPAEEQSSLRHCPDEPGIGFASHYPRNEKRGGKQWIISAIHSVT